jgi:flagellar motor protein MotB
MRERRQKRGSLINQWPPFVDAMVLVFAAFFFITLIALVKQQRTLGSLEAQSAELERLRADKARIEKRLSTLAGSAAFVEVEDGKVILQGEVLFDSGSAELRPEGEKFLRTLALPLKQLLDAERDQMVMIAGHTDDVPLRASARFSSNWELSTARATSVAKALSAAELPEAKVIAAGFGQHHPRVPNTDEAARKQNRRIEVLLVPMHAVTNQ